MDSNVVHCAIVGAFCPIFFTQVIMSDDELQMTTVIFSHSWMPPSERSLHPSRSPILFWHVFILRFCDSV